MTDAEPAVIIRWVTAAFVAICVGVLGWKLTHSVINHVVHSVVANHALTHLSALLVAGGFMAAGSVAAIAATVSPDSTLWSPRNPRMIRAIGALPLAGFFLTSIADQLASSDHELSPVLLLALGAIVESVIGVTTSTVWRSCARVLRKWIRWLVSPGRAVPSAIPTIDLTLARIRPKLWSSINPRRGPPASALALRDVRASQCGNGAPRRRSARRRGRHPFIWRRGRMIDRS